MTNPTSTEAASLAEALRKLSFAAQITGGVAGRDEHLCAAIDGATVALAAYDAAQAHNEQSQQAAVTPMDIPHPRNLRELIAKWKWQHSKTVSSKQTDYDVGFQHAASELENMVTAMGSVEGGEAQPPSDIDWERGRYPGKVTQHWLRVAFERIAAGEPEVEVLDDYGYTSQHAPAEQQAPSEAQQSGARSEGAPGKG